MVLKTPKNCERSQVVTEQGDEEQWQSEGDQRSQNAATLFAKFVKIVAELRHPVRGCSWDLKQNHQSLRRFILEEAYEASEAMDLGDPDKITEELGDVLLQVVLNSQLLVDDKRGDICQVIQGITDKMVRRHPHVFAAEPYTAKLTSTEVKTQWQKIKDAEKSSLFPKQADHDRSVVFAEAEKTRHPATLQALKIGKIAERVGFDWHNSTDVLAHLESELDELKIEIQSLTTDRQRLIDEMGDVYFTLAQLCRHLKLDPEVAAQSGNLKFLRRFRLVEALARDEGIDLQQVPIDEWEKLWQKAKQVAVSNDDQK